MISTAHPLLSAVEEIAVLRVHASGRLAQGEQVAAFERHFAEDVRLPVVEMAAEQALSLPVHPALRTRDLTSIGREVRALCD